ncbi:cytochrome c oxidase assembly protein [Opitutus sp. ER46]|uniref:cytochrome c oxidase assembly protein n=1 Tax=Opitutus sp. ER46 TaxID=2161864 RepID=UPI000D30BEC0|nr:cytochrome c oxidase assembly protein [Opitutus sp. ER46]PTX96385.1 cytochrome c oxidase assembly protein [Opitutus sp. ER46]
MIDWLHWHNEPLLVGGLVFVGWLWAILAGPLRAHLLVRDGESADRPFPKREAFRFYGALLVFYFAVGSPLDQIGEAYLFSAHMLQHQLLIYPAAILFLWGIPSWMIDPFLRQPPWSAGLRFLTHPLICALVFLLVVGGWHAPWLYNAALMNKLIHVGEHLAFFGSALLYWWPIMSPSRVLPPVGYGTQMLYVLGVIIGLMPVHAYITFSHDILYPVYEYAPRLFTSFSAADDQLLAGVSMQLVAILVSLGAFGVSFYRWYEQGERRGPGASGAPKPLPAA